MIGEFVGYKTAYEGKMSILPISKLPSTGFATVYLYDKSAIDFINKYSAIKGYAATNPVVYSEVFYVDFDDCEEEARNFYKYLVNEGIWFKVYNSGGRSIHFHIRRVEQHSSNLPYSDRKWIESIAPKADMSLYQATRVFRMEGTLHHRTGKKKVLIEEVKGRPLEVPILIKPSYTYESSDTTNYKRVFDDSIIYQSIMGFVAGSREQNIFQVITHLKEYGMSKEFIEEFVRCVNAQCLPEIEEDKLDYLLGYYLG